MSTLQFLEGMCEEMDALVRRFWWNSKSNNGQYFIPIAWSLCASLKKESGTSIKPSFPSFLGGHCLKRIAHA